MIKKFQRALFIFRRDLRLEDNTGLIYALQSAKEVIPAFIFTPEQIDHNPYRSDHCLQFMIECLEGLERSIHLKKGKLYLFFARPEEVVSKFIRELNVDAVVVNQDYTPYSIERDRKIAAICKDLKIAFYSFEDALLHPIADTLKSNGKPYTVFTPYYRNASRLPVLQPIANHDHNYYSQPIPFAESSQLYERILPKRRSLAIKGGRSQALKILESLSTYADYVFKRDFPAEDATTHLSAHLKFTTCSPREVYAAIVKQLGPQGDLIRSLYWRDFFTSIAFYFPDVFKGAFKTEFNHLKWNNDQQLFMRWCKGETGFPIVDAGMREMNQTGYMHNRVRMIVASFLVKDLHINWRWGEKYFAQTLIDYDPAVNNGNWQWAASTGCDAQPYFRIFNPWLQQQKFDPACVYIKRWIPELNSVPIKAIHQWYLEEYHTIDTGYTVPIVDHSIESKIALELYKQARGLNKNCNDI